MRRVIGGGLVCGVTIDVLDTAINEGLFGSSWAAAYGALGLSPDAAVLGGYWMAFGLLVGVVIVALYHGLSARFGSGLRTALSSVAVVYVLVHATLWSHLADGVFPPSLLLGTGALEAVSWALAGAIGARIADPAVRAETASAS